MNPLAIVGIVAVLLGAGLGVTGKLLIDSHEKIGELKVDIANKQAIIDQKEKDAKLSEQLVALQTLVETKLKNVGNETRQAINNATTDDEAARATRDGIMRLRAARNPGSTPR